MGYVTTYWLEVEGVKKEEVVAAADFWVHCYKKAYIEVPGVYGQKSRWGDLASELAGFKLIARFYPEASITLFAQGEEEETPRRIPITSEIEAKT